MEGFLVEVRRLRTLILVRESRRQEREVWIRLVNGIPQCRRSHISGASWMIVMMMMPSGTLMHRLAE